MTCDEAEPGKGKSSSVIVGHQLWDAPSRVMPRAQGGGMPWMTSSAISGPAPASCSRNFLQGIHQLYLPLRQQRNSHRHPGPEHRQGARE